MRSVDETERFVRKMSFKVNREMDQALRSDLLHSQRKQGQIDARPIAMGRLIMGNNYTRVAAMVALTISVLAILSILSHSTDPASVALARVRETFLAQPWIHVTYDNGRQEWRDLSDGKYACLREEGWCYFIDPAANTHQEYSPRNDYIFEMIPKTYADGQVPPWEPEIVWQALLSFLANEKTRPLGRYTEVTHSMDTVDGQQVIRLDIYYLDALNNKVLVTQIWTDPESRLPKRIQSRPPAAVRERYGAAFLTGTCDFPATGPESIFDLGAPRGLRIVRQSDPIKEATPEVQQIVQKSREAARTFAGCYRAVLWFSREPNQTGTIDILYRSGERLRYSHYFNLTAAEHLDAHLNFPATPTQIAAWAETQVPVSVGVYDGVNVFQRRNVHPYVAVNDRTSAEVRRASVGSIPDFLNLECDLWSHVYKGQHLQLVANRPETPAGSVTLRGGGTYYFVDPQKDYISVRTRYTGTSDGSGPATSEVLLSDFAQLPSGRWYAQKKTTSYQAASAAPKGEVPMVNEVNVRIQFLRPEDLPVDLFDGQRLLEGAQLQTY
jgi:hypothetical protein